MEFDAVLRRRRMVRRTTRPDRCPTRRSTPCWPRPYAHPRPDSPRAPRSWCCPRRKTARRTGRRRRTGNPVGCAACGQRPVLILVWTSREAYLDRYSEPDKGWTDRDLAHWPAPYWYIDAGMASMAALLAAVDLGLGACFFGVPTARIGGVRAVFGVPDDQLSVGVISLGYPAPTERPSGSPTRRARRPAGQLLHHGRW